MRAINDLSIETFLPVSRMREMVETSHEDYIKAEPFPHVVLDNFFDPVLIDEILGEFPLPGAIRWQKFDNAQEIKLASSKDASFGPLTRLFMYHLNSITFLEFLSGVTGISNLIPDPAFEGGGLHQIVPGGKLGVHADFNKHRDSGLDRRLNVILYLNKNWREEYGGYLQLWNREVTRCEAKILPIFNRLLIFGTTDFTFHGHPDPLTCPEGMSRKSLALYYFSNGRPKEEITGEHSTIFRARDKKDFAPTFRQRALQVASDLVPPIIMKSLRKVV